MRSGQRGISSLEVATGVSLCCILVSVAIPGYVRMNRAARRNEVADNLRRMYDASLAYYTSERGRGTGQARQFPASTRIAPVVKCCLSPTERCLLGRSAWANEPTFNALAFSIDEPFYFQYQYESQGQGVGANFTVRALGDLNCDGKMSTYERTASVDASQNLVETRPMFIKNE
jgi:hypothetical protein